MRLWIFSDLHQDWQDNAWDPCAHAPDHDIAVVAGDVHSPLTSAIDWLADRLPGVPTSKYPPAKPGALGRWPLEAAEDATPWLLTWETRADGGASQTLS